jgi:hypothetical protein
MSTRYVRLAAKMGVAFWLLLSPGENWTWVIVGGHDVHEGCEQARVERLDGEYLVCAAAPSWTARPAAVDTSGSPGDTGPSPSLTRRLNDRERP